MLRGMVLGGLTALAAYMLVQSVPDVARYIRMREM
jgi:hypothetical protein